MSKTIDYTKLATTLDYPALERKLTRLAEQSPPKKRKHVIDVLEPLHGKLLELRNNGWSSGQLAEELSAAGIPVSSARLRECFNRWGAGGRKTGSTRSRGPSSKRRDNTRPATSTPPTKQSPAPPAQSSLGFR